MDTHLLTDRVALVTGAGRGIGRAIAIKLAARGAKVAINDLDPASARTVAEELGGLAAPADVAGRAAAEAMVARVLDHFGRVDILVNNAGADHACPLVEMSEEEWDRYLAINLKSVYFCSKAVLPSMLETGKGRIVSLSSQTGRQGALKGGIHYATAKAGVLGFTRTLARQVSSRGITVNAIAPGIIDTDLVRSNLDPATLEALEASLPIGRLGQASEVAGVVAFLVSDDASYVTGATIDINGGSWMG